MDVKDGGGYRSRGVVLREDVLQYFRNPSDARPEGTIPNVSAFTLTTKKGRIFERGWLNVMTDRQGRVGEAQIH